MSTQQLLIPPDVPVPIVTAGAIPTNTKPLHLGTIDGKEYYLDVDPKSATFNQVIWKIPDIRDSIKAEPGFVIVASDYSQIEIRIMAFLSKDPWLIEAINSKKDMHCYMATDVFGAEMGFTYDDIAAATKGDDAKLHPRYKELTDVRNQIKRTSFGIPYGISPVGLALLIGKDEKVAANLMARFFGKAAVLKQWLERQGDFAVNYGYTATLLGRKRFYPIPASDDPDAEAKLQQIRRWSGNHPVQGSNADMLKLALHKLYLDLRDGSYLNPAKWDARILFVVHDEIVTTCREEHADEMKLVLEGAMDWSYDRLISSDQVWHNSKAVVADVWAKA